MIEPALACERWDALFDRAAVGDPISEHDARFQRLHECECRRCKDHAGRWRDLGLLSDVPALGSEHQRDLVDEVVKTHRAKSATKSAGTAGSRRSTRRWAVATGVVMAAAAAVMLMVRSPQPGGATARVSLSIVGASGSARIDGRPVRAGERAEIGAEVDTGEGAIVFYIQPDVRVFIDKHSVARIVDSSALHREVELRRGKILATLKPHLPGTSPTVSVTLSVAGQRFTATSSTFSVEMIEGAEPIARVVQGEVRSEAMPAEPIGAHEAIGVTSKSRRGLSSEEEERDLAVARAARLLTAENAGRLDVSGTSGSEIRIDQTPLGGSSLSVLLSTGTHHVELWTGSQRARQEDVLIETGHTVTRTTAPEEQPLGSSGATPSGTDRTVVASAPPASVANVPPASVANVPPPSKSPRGDLLRRALELRGHGRFGEAAEVYRRLQAAQPDTPEARAALVSLGDLELSRLKQPTQALRHFDAYLATGDRKLSVEASYGRVSALRALGRTDAERTAIEQHLKSHPSGMFAEGLRARLGELSDRGTAERQER